MAQDYIIKDVKLGDQWSNDYGTFQSMALALEGIAEPVQINKKVKDDGGFYELKSGDEIYGDLNLVSSENGKTYYKFKSVQKNSGFSKSKGETIKGSATTQFKADPEKQASIEAQSARKDAVALVIACEGDLDKVNAWLKLVDATQRHFLGQDKPAVEKEAPEKEVVPEDIPEGELDLGDITF